MTTGTVTFLGPSKRPPGATWAPVIGDQANSLMERQTKLSDEARERTVQSAAAILGRGQNPATSGGARTGLVVGYVQSGKTLSFTTVVALARDNDIPLVIVVAGTSEPLFHQTRDRLAEELRIGEDDVPPAWHHIANPGLENEEMIRKILQDWRDPELGRGDRATVLMTVMKQHQRLKNLNDLLTRLRLNGISAVIIDDEADQASLNTLINRGRESTTYQRLLEMKRLLPNHTFLQYTATPQAPLLINIIDAMSPDFVEVLEPGAGYVGGLQFFGDNSPYSLVIPQNDVPSRNNPISGIPDSLVEALAFFLVSVAVGLIEGRSKANPNRSMLVHPSRTTLEHFQYYQSIISVRDDWLTILTGSEGEPDRLTLIADFKTAYDDLAGTVSDLPAFDDVLKKLPRALRETQVREVNRRGGQKTPAIEWKQAYGWILVGGQAMDRGFTVRELSVTYMPRDTGVGNADTLQQRARFFGYKQRYLGHCRLYLETGALDAFEAYVEHEEEMRKELITLQESGALLSTWKRKFILDPALQPCRSNVIQHDFGRGNYSDDWFHPTMAKMSDDAIESNTSVVGTFLSRFSLEADSTYISDQPAQQHYVVDGVPLKAVVEDLLVNYRVQGPNDSKDVIGLLLQLQRAIETDEAETARVYRMRPNYKASRGLDDQGRIPSIRRLHQGPTRAPGGYSYPGDRAFCDLDRVTIQIHFFDLTEDPNDTVVCQSVPLLAIWVPRRMEADWVTQDQDD